MTGTVSIARSLFDHEFFAEEPMTEREAWIWLIMEASWKPRKKRAGDVIVDLRRGQLAASVRFLAGAWKWTASRVQRYLKRLEKMEMIAAKADTGVTVITICNYDEYQSSPQASDTAPIQERYRSDTNEKKGEIREEGISSPDGEDARAPAPKERRKPAEPEETPLSILEAIVGHDAAASFVDYRKRAKRGAFTVTASKRLASNLRAIFDGGGSPDDALGMAEEKGWMTVEPDWYFKNRGQHANERRSGFSDQAPYPARSSPHDGLFDAFSRSAARHD